MCVGKDLDEGGSEVGQAIAGTASVLRSKSTCSTWTLVLQAESDSLTRSLSATAATEVSQTAAAVQRQAVAPPLAASAVLFKGHANFRACVGL